MDNRLREILIRKISERIPDNIQPVDYLSELLQLGRDSIYRRLNGHIDFTITDIVAITTRLNLSIDEIQSEYDNELAIFCFDNERFISFEKSAQYIFNMLKLHHDNLIRISNAKSGCIINSFNRLPGYYYLKYKHLSLFIYYKWAHQLDIIPINYYSNIQISPEIENLMTATRQYGYRFDLMLIIDDNILYSIITEIKYYHESGLLSDNDVESIKNELKEFCTDLEYILQNGFDPSGTKWDIYLSSINICSNVTYIKCDESESTFFNIHSDGCIYTYDEQVCRLQKKSLESLKKYSTLITCSNKKTQLEFINKQYGYINKL